MTPPNFLFTFGPRPFWELWPQKKKRLRKRLSLDEFKRSLLEQWAKANRIPPSRVSQVFSPVTTPPSGGPTQLRKSYPNDDLISILPIDRSNGGGTVKPQKGTKRLMRRVARVTRRYQVMQKLTRSLGLNSQQQNEALDTVARRGSHQSHHQGGHMFSFFKRKKRRSGGVGGSSSVGGGGGGNGKRNVTISAPLQVSRSPESHRKRLAGVQVSPRKPLTPSTPQNDALLNVKTTETDRKSRLVYLERQVIVQQQEITSLKSVIRELR